MSKLTAFPVKNRSGFEIRSEKLVPPLREGYYEIVEAPSVAGDAPKDVVRVYEYGEARKDNPGNWPIYIAKVAEKWYPNESVMEHLLTRIGECIGVNMAESRLMRADRQIRFLSKYFLKSEERLVHGAEIFAGYLEDDKFVEEVEEEGLAREVFTFQFAVRAIRDRFPVEQESIVADFIRMLGFDALVGNNDRHYYNWGVIVHPRGHRQPRFSPIFDSARALFWNHPEKKVAQKTSTSSKSKKYIEKYAKGAHPKLGWEGLQSVNHFELMRLISEEHPSHQSLLLDLCRPKALKKIRQTIETEFELLMSEMRRELVLHCLFHRAERYKAMVS